MTLYARVSDEFVAYPRGRLRSLLITCACVTCLAGTAVASAEPSASDRATARSLAGEGYAALKKKDYATAEDRFRRADELVHAPTLVIDHARALVGLGRVGEAYEAYQSVVHEDVPASAPPVWKRAARDAQRELDALAPRVAWLTISVKGPPEPHVEVDGRVLPTTALGQRQPTNPGERSVVISAPGYIAQDSKQVLAEGAETSLEVELLPEPKPEPVVVMAPPVVASPGDLEGERKDKRQRTFAYVAFGVAGLGVAVGATTGILWLKARSDVNSACGGLSCNAQNSNDETRFNDDKRRYNTFGTISGVGFAVGVVGAATGAALLLFDSNSEASKATKSAHWSPYVGPGSFGIHGAF